MKINKLLAGTLALVLIAGLVGSSFAQKNELMTDENVFTEPSNLATPKNVASPTATIILTGPGDFSGSETVIGFESLGGVIPPPGPFSIGDVTFSEFSSGTGPPGWNLITALGLFGTPDPQLVDLAGISFFRIDFSTTVNRVGLIAGIGPADYEVSFFDNTLTIIETIPISSLTVLDGSFAGIESDTPISRVEIVETSGENVLVGGIDDIRFEFVEPPVVGGEFLPIDNTALLLAGAQTFSWMIPLVLSGIGIGLFVVSRKR